MKMTILTVLEVVPKTGLDWSICSLALTGSSPVSGNTGAERPISERKKLGIEMTIVVAFEVWYPRSHGG